MNVIRQMLRESGIRQARDEYGAGPCPCCGHAPLVSYAYHYPRSNGCTGCGSAIYCTNRRCGLVLSVPRRGSGGIREAVRRWNRRPKPDKRGGAR
jgi:hypothetical protein